MSFDLQNLNPEQRLAVDHTQGPLLILAGAGSGKTRVLVSRVGKILSQDPNAGICVLTFTNKAAKELKHRVHDQIGAKVKNLWAGTFHSFGLQIMRKYSKRLGLNKNFSVADQTDAQAVVKDILINISNTGKNNFQTDKLLNIMNDWRANPSSNGFGDEDYLAVAKVLLPKYEQRLRSLGVVDFEDLLLKPLQLFEENPDVLEKVKGLFKYMMVDEFQDTNDLQFKLLKKLVAPENNIAVVGDDDQSIYGWRGAQVKNILEFPKMFESCQVIQLDRNYRSSSAILDMANFVIAKNIDRHGKTLKAENNPTDISKPEVFVFEDDQEEIEQVCRLIEEFHRRGYKHSDMAVLYRSNGQGGFLETELRANQIPYSITGGTAFFERREIKDALAYLNCLFWPREIDFRRVLNVPLRGVGDETIRKIEELAELNGRSFVKQAYTFQNHEGVMKFISELEMLRLMLLDEQNQEWDRQLVRFLQNIGYQNYLRKFCKNDEALAKRWASIEIFARVFGNFMRKFQDPKKGLREFIDMMNLRDHDLEAGEKQPDEVQLMTLHGAKGLEFPVVFIIGVEEDIIPHARLGSDISEERRLFYVGITRAQEKLIFTHTRTRKKFGRMQEVAPSRFLLEIDKNLYTHHASGYRPVDVSEKENLLAQLQAKLNQNIEKQQIEKDY